MDNTNWLLNWLRWLVHFNAEDLELKQRPQNFIP
jgi:hypothetical protein